MADLLAENRVGRQTDRMTEIFGFEERENFRASKSNVGPEVTLPQRLPSILRDHRAQDITPAMRAPHIARTKPTPFKIAILVEHEDRVIPNTAEVAKR